MRKCLRHGCRADALADSNYCETHRPGSSRDDVYQSRRGGGEEDPAGATPPPARGWPIKRGRK
jgi:hypothetical protein